MWSDNWNVVLYTQLHWIHSSIMQATNRKDCNCAIWQIHFGTFVNNICFYLLWLTKKPELPWGSEWVYLTWREPVKCQHLWGVITSAVWFSDTYGECILQTWKLLILSKFFPLGDGVLIVFLCLCLCLFLFTNLFPCYSSLVKI